MLPFDDFMFGKFWPLALFFLLCFAISLFAARGWGHKRGWWATCDYITLIAAAAALLIANSEVRRTRASWQVNWVSMAAQSRCEDAVHGAKFYEQFYSTGLPFEDWKRKGLDTKPFEVAASWFKDASSSLSSECHDESAVQQFLETHRPVAEPADIKQAEQAEFEAIRAVAAEKNRLTSTKAIASQNELDVTLLMLNPFFIAVAVALQASKTTAEWRQWKA